jgi:2,4-dienoyl-CoA reductase-like NADH-dependent reductase (Old Yellow Enzyme family)
MAGLFDPIEIKGLTLKNRIVLPPMETGTGTTDGQPTEKTIIHYVERAKGGAGLIIVEHTFVSPDGRFSKYQLGLHTDENISAFKKLVKEIHKVGVPVALQINHAGLRGSFASGEGKPLGPSDVPLPESNEKPISLSIIDIERIIKNFADAAQRAFEAGFDAVEIHGAHGFLLNSFTSPITNQRNDKYGGSFEDRIRFPLEVVKEARKNIGREVPLFYRLGADDELPEGFSLAEASQLAKELVSAGIDLIDVSGGLCGSRPKNMQVGHFVPHAATIKKAIDVPVIAVGRITEPKFADQIIREKKADLVAVGRAFLKDPHWGLKAKNALTS